MEKRKVVILVLVLLIVVGIVSFTDFSNVGNSVRSIPRTMKEGAVYNFNFLGEVYKISVTKVFVESAEVEFLIENSEGLQDKFVVGMYERKTINPNVGELSIYVNKVWELGFMKKSRYCYLYIGDF